MLDKPDSPLRQRMIEDMTARFGVDQLNVDAHAISAALHTAFEGSQQSCGSRPSCPSTHDAQ
jgi:hypothetical protein